MTSLFKSNNRFTRSYLLAVLFSLLILTSSLFSVPKSFTIPSNVQGFEEENTSNQDDGSTQYEENDKGTNDNTQESDGDFSSTSTRETGGLNQDGASNDGSQDKVGSKEATENVND